MNSSSDAPALRVEMDDPIGETAQRLIGDLCAEMSARYGAPPSPFSLGESPVARSVFLVARLNGEAVGCGGLRPWDDSVAEIKRMYVAPVGRRRGVARRMLAELERNARQLGYGRIRLETGVLQPEAQALYESVGFQRIPAFAPYVGNPSSVCFEKVISDDSPAAVVQRQFEAYNARDLDALQTAYAEDAEQFEYPSTLLARGWPQLRERFALRFQEPNLQARLLHRTVAGHVVIDHEEISRTFPEGPGRQELVAIYEVRNGRIAVARFISGRKTVEVAGPFSPAI